MLIQISRQLQTKTFLDQWSSPCR